MKVTIVFNNFNLSRDLAGAWGMAAVVDTGAEHVLFDTGSRGEILLENMKRLDISPFQISKVVISHNHWDHTGGLADFLSVNPAVTIYAPELDHDLVFRAQGGGAEVFLVREPVQVVPGVRTSGVFVHPLPEQALILETSSGHVILTGCSHPGVVNLVLAAPAPRYLVTGGFHLFRSSPEAIRAAAEGLEEAGIELVAPSHCTGEAALEYFRRFFDRRFLYGGLGAVFEV